MLWLRWVVWAYGRLTCVKLEEREIFEPELKGEAIPTEVVHMVPLPNPRQAVVPRSDEVQ